MARLPRLVLPQQPHILIQRAIDQLTVFRDADDFAVYLRWLREAARQFKVAVHAYVLLPNEVQLLASPADETGLAKMMQWLGRHYVPYFNAKYGRAGTLWQGRYRATLVDPDPYLLLCTQYIETAPVRAGLAATAADYPWSSNLHHIGLKPDPVVTEHASYWLLGNTPFDREGAYKNLLEQGLSSAQLRLLDDSAHKGWPLGSEHFKTALGKKVSRPVVPGRRGRPRKTAVQSA
ncbi:transposase [Oxalobacteraceae bacterium OM1]|nr:transposase [Oxalobacteraceae bacterium OM1]